MSEIEPQVISYAWRVDTGSKGSFLPGGWFGGAQSSELSTPNVQTPQHVGLFAFGHLYEYSAMGVTASRMSSKSGVFSQCNVAMDATKATPLGTPKITQREFHEWLDSSSEAFSRDNFDIATYNSVTWAEEASRVLGVHPDKEWSTFRDFYLNNAESSKRLSYASPNAVSRHRWVGKSDKHCVIS